jgi:hypothetical protein
MIDVQQLGAPDPRRGPVLVATPDDEPSLIEALLVRAALAGGHRRLQATRVLNGWVIHAFDE